MRTDKVMGNNANLYFKVTGSNSERALFFSKVERNRIKAFLAAHTKVDWPRSIHLRIKN